MTMSDQPDDVVAAAEELTQLVGRLRDAGPEDAEMWALKRDISRQVLARGGIPSEEIEAALRRATESDGPTQA